MSVRFWRIALGCLIAVTLYAGFLLACILYPELWLHMLGVY